MAQQLGYEPAAVYQIGAAVAANAGPRVVGAAFTRKKEGKAFMKAAQITHYSKDIQIIVNDIPVPEIGDDDILIRVKAAAVNPVDILNLSGAVRLIQDYKMPLTLGNKCSGIVERTGKLVTMFRPGDRVYSRLPVSSLGAFAEYVSVPALAAARMPEGLDFVTAAAIPLTGLTAYQALTEELCAKPGQTLFIPGGSGSFGQMAVPIAKAMGLRVIVSGNARAKDALLSAGADRYIVYTEENYWETLSCVDCVIDTLGENEFDHELSVLKENGILLSLRGIPNGAFAQKNGFPLIKRLLFTLAGAKYDRKAKRQGKAYLFLFVRSDGVQLESITQIVEANHIVPKIDPREFDLSQISDALNLVAGGHINGKVMVRFS